MNLTSVTSALAPARKIFRPRVVDRLEQAAILLLWFFLVRRMMGADNPLAALVLITETSVVVLNTIRRTTDDISINPTDWVLAATATGVVMLVQPEPTPWPALAPLGIALVTFGNLLQLSAKLFLLRSFGIAPANRGIKVAGTYRFVRHPMYAGDAVMMIGMPLALGSYWGLIFVIPGAAALAAGLEAARQRWSEFSQRGLAEAAHLDWDDIAAVFEAHIQA